MLSPIAQSRMTRLRRRGLAQVRTMALVVSLPLLAQEDDVLRSGDNLVVEGIPPIPISVVEEANRYAEFRSAALASWHPTRREMLVLTRFADTNQVHAVAMPGGARTQLTFFPDRVSAAAYPPKDGRFFVFSKDVGGGEWFQIYRFDVETGDHALLTDGKSRNSLGPWSNAGGRIAYTSTRRTGRDTDLYVVDPSNPASDRLIAQVEGGGWFPIEWSPDDAKLLVTEYVSINESYLWLVDVATAEKRLITPKGGGEPVAYRDAAFSRDGQGVYVATDKDSEFRRLAYIDLSSGSHTYLTSRIVWDVESLELSRDGRRLAFITNEEGIGVLHLLDTATRQELPAPRLPVGVVSNLVWHENSRDLGFQISSAQSPSDVYSLDVTTGTLDRWTRSETGGLNPSGFVTPRLVRWKSFDGRVISGFLYQPPAKFTGRRPVMISIHGGPESQARPGFLGRTNYYINELGIALLVPNVRGSSGFGKAFLKLDNGLLREDSYKDINALFDWIGSQPDLDAVRVLVTGGSYGGFMTLAIAATYPDRIRCAVSVVGVSNLRTFLERTESYRRDLRRAEYGDERDPQIRAFFEKIAAVNNAHRMTKPLFVVQGKNDPRVPWTESQQIVETVRKNGTPVWYLLANDEGHGFAKKKNQDYQFYATILFLRRFL